MHGVICNGRLQEQGFHLKKGERGETLFVQPALLHSECKQGENGNAAAATTRLNYSSLCFYI